MPPHPPRRRSSLLLLATLSTLAGAALSCTDTTAPEPHFDVSSYFTNVSAPTVGPWYAAEPEISCSAHLQVRSNGPGEAVLDEGVFRLFVGPDSLVAVDSLVQSAAELVEIYGDSIVPTTTATVQWTFRLSQPFWIEFELRYRAPGRHRVQEATSRFRCVPGPNWDTPAPTIELLEFTASDDVLDPGDTLHITYKADAPTGIFRFGVYVSGGFSAYNQHEENGLTTKTRTAHLIVPPRSGLGEPVVLELFVIDQMLRRVNLQVNTGLTVHDVRPPVLLPLNVHDNFVLVGRKLIVTALAADDHFMRWFIWETSGPGAIRDSVSRAQLEYYESVAEFDIMIPVKPEWVDDPAWGLTVWARDALGQLSAPRTLDAATFTFVPVGQAVVSPELYLSHPIGDHVYDAKRNRLYWTWDVPFRLGTLDIATMTELAAVPLPALPFGIDLAPRGDSVVVTQFESRSLAVFDLVTRTLKSPIALTGIGPGGAGGVPVPNAVRVAANGKALVVLSGPAAGGERILEVDLNSGVQQLRSDALVGDDDINRWYARLGVTPDRERIQFLGNSCFRSYQSATDAFGPCVPLPNPLTGLGSPTFAPGTDRIAAGRHILASDLTPLAYIDWANTAITPDGEHVYAAFSSLAYNYLLRVRISDGKVMRGVVLPIQYDRFILLPDGQTLLAVFGPYVSKVTLNGF